MAAIFRDLARLLSRTSHPSGTAAGDVWWRSDLSQAHASDGGTSPLTIGPAGNIPAIRSGGWHLIPAYGTPSVVTTTANRACAMSLWPGRSCTLEGVALEVTVAAAGSIRTGLYDDGGAVPGNLIQDFGTVSSSTTGVKTWSPTPVALRPVLHWLVVATTASITLRFCSTGDPIIGDTATSFLANSRNAYRREGVSGALPAAFAMDGVTSGPAVLLQLT